MTALMSKPIGMNDWRTANASRNGTSKSRSAHAANSGRSPAVQSEGNRWETIIDEIGAMHHLGDKWDGLSAAAPSRELLESAIGLAYLLKDAGGVAPTLAVSGTDGSVNFLWHFPDGTYCEVEIDRPLHADVMLLEPGKEPRHWELPNA